MLHFAYEDESIGLVVEHPVDHADRLAQGVIRQLGCHPTHGVGGHSRHVVDLGLPGDKPVWRQ